jgi:hypothetical protein
MELTVTGTQEARRKYLHLWDFMFVDLSLGTTVLRAFMGHKKSRSARICTMTRMFCLNRPTTFICVV